MTEADLTSFLLQDIESLYENNEDSNVTIKVNQESFKAHSLILKSRSQYFRKSINEYLQRRNSLFNRGGDCINLEVTDISPRAFRVCLKYIYTGKFSLDDYNNEFIFSLTIAADELGLLCMVDELEKFYLMRNLAPPSNENPRKLRRDPTTLKRNSSIFKPKYRRGEPASEVKPEALDEVSVRPLTQDRSPSPFPRFRLPDIKFNSKLIDNTQLKRISRWIDGDDQGGVENSNLNNNFTLLARGSRDGMDLKTFASLCNDKGPTLVLAKVDKTNIIIGGYNPEPWKSTNKWIVTDESFIFSFKSYQSREGIDDIILSRVKDTYAAIFDGDSHYGIGFGTDLRIFSGEYVHEHYIKRILDQSVFEIENYEVFKSAYRHRLLHKRERINLMKKTRLLGDQKSPYPKTWGAQ
ncbi:9516_t:CDS:2, partial [Funneliformis caledonium]